MVDNRKHFIPNSSYECAKYNKTSLNPCLHCDECTVLERVIGVICPEKDLYDYTRRKERIDEHDKRRSNGNP